MPAAPPGFRRIWAARGNEKGWALGKTHGTHCTQWAEKLHSPRQVGGEAGSTGYMASLAHQVNAGDPLETHTM